MSRSCVVTGGGRGVGRAIAERLLADGGTVVVVDRDDAALGWVSDHPDRRRVIPVTGDAADEAVTGQAADLAQAAGRLGGWVNKDQMRALHPLGRVGHPAEVAAAVSYLLSADASFINGAVLPVDGGRSVLGLDPEEA